MKWTTQEIKEYGLPLLQKLFAFDDDRVGWSYTDIHGLEFLEEYELKWVIRLAALGYINWDPETDQFALSDKGLEFMS